jgi:hypothetical protein
MTGPRNSRRTPIRAAIRVPGTLVLLALLGLAPAPTPVPRDFPVNPLCAAEGVAFTGNPFAFAPATRAPAHSGALIFRLEGPNDGEPLERGRVPIWLTTNFSRAGQLLISINGQVTGSRVFFPTPQETRASAVTVRLEVDLNVARRLLGLDLLDNDAGPALIRVSLHETTGSLVTTASWHGYLGNVPWLQFVAPVTEEFEDEDPLADLWERIEDFADIESLEAYLDLEDDQLLQEYWDMIGEARSARRTLEQEGDLSTGPTFGGDALIVPPNSLGPLNIARTWRGPPSTPCSSVVRRFWPRAR